MLAMHAWPWEEPRFDMWIFAFDIGEEFNPVDGATLGRFFRPNDGDIILCVAGHHTGLAPRASIQIDHHSPLMHIKPLTHIKSEIRISKLETNPNSQNSNVLNFCFGHLNLVI
jgi:hypothetical protein